MKKLENAPAYGKEQLVKSGKVNRDAAQALLRDDRQYTAEEAEQAVKKFMTREVK